jgi:spermidine synthase
VTTSTRGNGIGYVWPIGLLLVGSGCAALIYEIVWFQVLQLVIGSSAASLAVVLGAFMGGMFAGSLLLPPRVSPDARPLMAFAALEAAIGACGAVLVFVMPLVGGLYTAVDPGGPSSVVLRALVSLALLWVPAMLMGATLPVVARCLDATSGGAARLALFYGANIAGGVIGCVSAGFYLLPSFDLVSASMTAVSLNAAAAVGAVLVARPTQHRQQSRTHVEGASASAVTREARGAWTPRGVYAAIALSGFTALGAEVVWTRLLSLLFGATTYTFSILLAVFLSGLGAGSAIGARLVLRAADPRRRLGWAQVGVMCALAWGAWMTTHGLLLWPIDTSRGPEEALGIRTDVYRAVLVMLPAAVLWGMSFPLAVGAAVRKPIEGLLSDARREDDDAGPTVARVYAANTLGAIAGAVLTALVFIPLTGTHGAAGVLIAAAALSAAITMWPTLKRSMPGASRASRARLAFAGAMVFVFLLTGVLIAAATVSRVPAGLVAWGRLLPWYGEPRALYVGEGVNASVAVTEDAHGWRSFHVSGKVEASTQPQDMRLQRLLGHLTALMPEHGPRSVLVVGFGAGVTAGAIALHPSVDRVVICELEPLIPKVVSRYFGEANYDVATDLKVRIVYDDARHYIVTGQEKFDAITSDPIHPWVKGAAALYTKEYFEHARSRLNPGGVMTQWVPLYESTEESVRSVIATFLQVFPDGSVWRNDDDNGRGYDAVLVGRLDATPIDVDAWQARIDRREFAKVRRSLADVGFESAVDVLATYLGRGRDLAPWLAGATINTDRNLRLQYLAGRAVNNNTGTQIRDAMLRYWRFPDDLFTGSGATVSFLQDALTARAAP